MSNTLASGPPGLVVPKPLNSTLFCAASSSYTGVRTNLHNDQGPVSYSDITVYEVGSQQPRSLGGPHPFSRMLHQAPTWERTWRQSVRRHS